MAGESENITAGQIIFSILFFFAFPVLVLFLSGDWFWVEGWIFGVWFLALCFISSIYLYLKDPALLAERFKRPGTGNQKKWDEYFLYAVMLLFLAWIVIMPLDAKRFRWTVGFPFWLKVVGGVGLLVSLFFLLRAFTDNTFLSPLVRIQKERKQQVISTGVYGFVRHPMYLGAALLFIGTPLLLGSLNGILIGILIILSMMWRITGEEKMLSEELEGYEDYKKKVKYRLIPFIW